MIIQKQKEFSGYKGYAVVRFSDREKALSFAVDLSGYDGVTNTTEPKEIDDEFFMMYQVIVRFEPCTKTEHKKLVSVAQKKAEKFKATMFRSLNS